MTSLIFQTPSKRCPLREFNGHPATIDYPLGKSFVRRIGRRVNLYAITIHVGNRLIYGTAMPDELFIEPPTQAEPRGSLVGTMDEYGTIWDGEPGTSNIIGDLISNDSDETHRVYLKRGPA